MRTMARNALSEREYVDVPLPERPTSPPRWEVPVPRRYEEAQQSADGDGSPEEQYPPPVPSAGEDGWKRMPGPGGRWMRNTFQAPPPLDDERHIIAEHNLRATFSDSNRNNPFAASFLSKKICRAYQCGACPFEKDEFCMQLSGKANWVPAYHRCSIYDAVRDAPCGGFHPSVMCPIWDLAMDKASVYKDFKQSWRFGRTDRGLKLDFEHMSEWSFYDGEHGPTVRKAYAEEVRDEVMRLEKHWTPELADKVAARNQEHAQQHVPKPLEVDSSMNTGWAMQRVECNLKRALKREASSSHPASSASSGGSMQVSFSAGASEGPAGEPRTEPVGSPSPQAAPRADPPQTSGGSIFGSVKWSPGGDSPQVTSTQASNWGFIPVKEEVLNRSPDQPFGTGLFGGQGKPGFSFGASASAAPAKPVTSIFGSDKVKKEPTPDATGAPAPASALASAEPVEASRPKAPPAAMSDEVRKAWPDGITDPPAAKSPLVPAVKVEPGGQSSSPPVAPSPAKESTPSRQDPGYFISTAPGQVNRVRTKGGSEPGPAAGSRARGKSPCLGKAEGFPDAEEDALPPKLGRRGGSPAPKPK